MDAMIMLPTVLQSYHGGIGLQLRSLMDQERARGHHPLGEPITGVELDCA